MTFLRARRWEIVIAILTLCVHAALFLAIVHTNDADVLTTVRADDGYYEIATNLLAGNGFSMATTSPYVQNALRTPGYIYPLAGLIAIVGATGAVIVQILLSALIPVLGMLIARCITDSVRISIAVGIVLALDPTLALLSFTFYTDTLFIFLFFAWILFIFRYLERPHWIVLAASATTLGFAIITRPTAQYIPLLIIPFILWQHGAAQWRRGVMHVVMSLAIVAAILTPWIVRNYNEFGAADLSSQRAYVLYANFAPAALSVARGTDFAIEVRTFTAVTKPWDDVINPLTAHIYTEKAFEIIFAHPAASAYVTLKSLYTFFMNDGVLPLLVALKQAPYDFLWLLIPARLVWVAITAAAFIGALVYLLKERSSLAILTILLVAYFALTSIIAAFGTNPRYRLPVDPILLAFAAVGGTYLFERIRRFRSFQ